MATTSARASISPEPSRRTARTGPRASKPTTSRARTISAPNLAAWAMARRVRSAPLSPLGNPR